MGFRDNFIKRWKIFIPIIFGVFCLLLIIMFSVKEDVKRDKAYTDKNDVALYIKKYHELPKNYLTKAGRDYFYNKKEDMSRYLVGGDSFYNDGKLKSYGVSSDVMLKECDIYYEGYSCLKDDLKRGTYRLVYETNTSNNRVWYTTDHYNNFDELTLLNLKPKYITLLIILIVYSVSNVIFLFCIYAPNIKKFVLKKEKHIN